VRTRPGGCALDIGMRTRIDARQLLQGIPERVRFQSLLRPTDEGRHPAGRTPARISRGSTGFLFADVPERPGKPVGGSGGGKCRHDRNSCEKSERL